MKEIRAIPSSVPSLCFTTDCLLGDIIFTYERVPLLWELHLP